MLAVYPQSYDDMRARHDEKEAINMIPFDRRAGIQRLGRSVASFFPGVVEAATINGEDGTSWWSYTKVTAGQVMLTFMAASHPGELVRVSHPRLQYSRSNERFLFEEMEPPPIALAEEPLFGIVLHGIGIENRRDLGFAVIRFPRPDFTGYYYEQIDLFAVFPAIVRDMRSGGRSSDDDFDIDLREGDEFA
jgi:hypothetical protein